MRAAVIPVTLLFCALLSAATADSGAKVEYVGGTLNLKSGRDVSLQWGGASELEIGQVRVPWRQVNQIEYGQKVSRQVAAAILISPLFLLNKSRKHFLTLGYTDAQGQQQAVVLRVAKKNVRGMLASLEARTGLRVSYQDDEARKM